MTGIPIKSIKQVLSELIHEELVDYCLTQSVLACVLMNQISPEANAAALVSNSKELLRGTELSKIIQDRVSELELERLRNN